jgi:pullulanase-type alpha-1,6-glucosidase
MAFTVPDSNGMNHLRSLAEAGLTHVHLLPAFDIATINENAAERVEPDYEALTAMPSDSDQQAAAINPIRDQDGFNWGYDPYHYTTPEGSYSTDPNGTARIVEFRQMVQSLNQNGLRVVMDVVYNHTNSSGQNPRSVLDRIVPGYYHRLNDNGTVATSTCCQNTATEHNMMRKLMVDSLVMWSTAYRVDGFRFDLMGHHMVNDMAAVRQALDALTVEANGVDGTKIYVYGEGWDFGEVAANARGLNATQLNVGGLGIGTFNDRIRDAARGGSPFGDRQFQGFINGLYTDPNSLTGGTAEEQLARLLHFSDQIMIGLAGNLRDYSIVDSTGNTVTGANIDYNGNPTGYTLDPQEHIAYVEAHDNETLFDKIQYAAPATATVQDRARMQWLGIDLVSLSQGVPFFHAGVDLLRSKSMDRNSYNSGDWFNRLDFTYQTNNWAVGLPGGDNADMYAVIQPLLADPNIRPTSAEITSTHQHFMEMLQIRRSSVLFRLRTAEDIEQRLGFDNTGPDQIPGVIVMSISDMGDLEDLDPNYEYIVVVFNGTPDEVAYTLDAAVGLNMELHPVQAASADTIVQGASFDSATGTFTVPGRTTAVFVLAQ